jgi:hypothetical protein
MLRNGEGATGETISSHLWVCKPPAMHQHRLFLFLLLSVFWQSLSAQKSSFLQKLNPDSLTARNLRFLPLPTVSVSPETGLRFGLYIDYFYRTRSTDTTRAVRPSLSFASVLYSTRGQLTAEVGTSTYTTDEKYFVSLRGGFIDNYERYWGFTEPTSGNNNFLESRYDRVYAQGRFSRNLGQSIFAGVGFLFSQHSSTTFEPKGNGLLPEIPMDNVNSRIAGGGVALTVDRRDNQFSPTRGWYADGAALINFDLRDGDYAYTTLAFDLRRYREWNRSVIATQALFSLSTGEMPLFEKWRLGGGNSLRGLFQGRYRDNNLWTTQAEYRYGINRFIKLAAFAAAGNTAPTTGRLFSETIQLGYGAGFRLLLNKDKKVYFRADAAFASNGQFGYYFRVGDAF